MVKIWERSDETTCNSKVVNRSNSNNNTSAMATKKSYLTVYYQQIRAQFEGYNKKKWYFQRKVLYKPGNLYMVLHSSVSIPVDTELKAFQLCFEWTLFDMTIVWIIWPEHFPFKAIPYIIEYIFQPLFRHPSAIKLHRMMNDKNTPGISVTMQCICIYSMHWVCGCNGNAVAIMHCTNGKMSMRVMSWMSLEQIV